MSNTGEPAGSNTDSGPVSRNKKYYLDDDLAIFLVANQLFRIHKFFLIRDSECFATMFELPPGEAGSVEGNTDDTPIMLPDVTVFEFECLLKFYYNGMHKSKKKPDHKSKEKKPEYNERKVRKWAALLSISTRLAFHKLRDRAIEELSTLRTSIDALERVYLAQRFDIPMWLRPAYEQLSDRQRPLEVWEAEKIGLVTTVLLARAREEVLRMSPFVSSSVSARRERVSSIIDSIFWPKGEQATGVTTS